MRNLRRFIPAWSASQRGVLTGFVFIMCGVLGFRAWRHPTYISDPQPEKPARFDELADKVDPNTADWPTLAALPQLGEKRAKQVVAFRENFFATHPGKIAFVNPMDLTQIRGIGKTTVETLLPHLTFPSTHATTQHL